MARQQNENEIFFKRNKPQTANKNSSIKLQLECSTLQRNYWSHLQLLYLTKR